MMNDVKKESENEDLNVNGHHPAPTAEAEFNQLRLLEALLFSTPELLTIKDLKPFFSADTDLESLLSELEKKYENSGINIVCRGHSWGFRTAEDLGDKLEVTHVVNRPLSRAATEMLSIIAYHQPVTRAEIEQIRGVTVSRSTLDILLEEELIRPGRRRESPGRPMTWKTTEHFLDYFSLESLNDLPNLKELKDSGLLTAEPPAYFTDQENASEKDPADTQTGLFDRDSQDDEFKA